VLARVFECETRTSCDVFHRLRDEDLSGTSLRRNPCADVNGDPAELVADDLALPGVYAEAEVDPDLAAYEVLGRFTCESWTGARGRRKDWGSTFGVCCLAFLCPRSWGG